MSLYCGAPGVRDRKGHDGGFTLVEALFAAALTAMLMIGLWKVVISATQAVAVGTWYSSRTSELRTGLRRLADDIGHASARSRITPTSVTVEDDRGDWKLRYKKGETKLRNQTGSGADLLVFYVCTPERAEFPPGADPGNRGGTIIECSLRTEGSSVRYVKSTKEGMPDPAELYDRVLFRDIDSIKMDAFRAREYVDAKNSSKQFCPREPMVHPKRGL